jgi:hypothetical protein
MPRPLGSLEAPRRGFWDRPVGDLLGQLYATPCRVDLRRGGSTQRLHGSSPRSRARAQHGPPPVGSLPPRLLRPGRRRLGSGICTRTRATKSMASILSSSISSGSSPGGDCTEAIGPCGSPKESRKSAAPDHQEHAGQC